MYVAVMVAYHISTYIHKCFVIFVMPNNILSTDDWLISTGWARKISEAAAFNWPHLKNTWTKFARFAPFNSIWSWTQLLTLFQFFCPPDSCLTRFWIIFMLPLITFFPAPKWLPHRLTLTAINTNATGRYPGTNWDWDHRRFQCASAYQLLNSLYEDFLEFRRHQRQRRTFCSKDHQCWFSASVLCYCRPYIVLLSK